MPTRLFYVYRTVTATSNIISIRQPATSGKTLQLVGVYFSCTLACTWAITKNGSVSGGSTGTINPLDDRGTANVSGAVYDGTVTSDTTVNSDSLSAAGNVGLAGCQFSSDGICRGGLTLSWDGTTRKMINLKLTSSGSGTLLIYGVYGEQ